MINSIFLTGCSKVQTLVPITILDDYSYERKIDKNYKLNEKNSAYIGSSMIKISDFNVVTTKTNKMKLNKDYSLKAEILQTFNFSKNDTFVIKGTWIIDGINYTAVNNKKYPDIFLLLDNNNNLIEDYLTRFSDNYLMFKPAFKTNISGMKFERIIDVSNNYKKGATNFELIYTGKNSNSFMLTYREYTSDDIARASFFQNLTYDISSKQIRFRDILIKINSIDNEKIVFTVLKDNL